ncbi:MAG: membrane protein insertase YidC [Betaproteobacteria bacterium]|nr:membrane protein insertase YidC [Betaproteobacteria bacterium]MSQ87819.1 membrane protein insertase YidC [Betaproteobacteria bacterium]
MDTQRLILFFIFGFSLLMLWDAWEKEHRPKPAPQAQVSTTTVPTPASKSASAALPAPAANGSVPGAAAPEAKSAAIVVRTDLMIAEIDTLGATLRQVELLKHKDAKGSARNLVLLGPEHRYEAQSGLTGEGGPNHRTLWSVLPGNTTLLDGQETVEVRLSAQGKEGLSVTKIYRFKRDSYVIDVALEISNSSAVALTPYAYFQLTHDGKSSADANAVASTFGAQSFNGYAVYSEEKKFEKAQLTDIDKGKTDFLKQSNNGWLAYVQHYFVAAWLPAAKVAREYAVEKRADGTYAGRALIPAGAIAPGASATVSVPLYVGPQEQNRLAEVAPGFDLVVDYGWLTIIAWPLFWLLEKFHGLSSNWGVAIVLLTVLIKLVFFPLSAASYKSMAKMKLVTPRMTKIREMYGDDRAKMNQAMMELYKTEKINPLGGCFPILVQIPVFIALYWVLLAAIELRHAPFMLWIQDLSALDPYYVLPVLMTLTMVIQTRLNPVPPDPVQAQVMKYMPFIFSIFFFFFPAGLVLYWLVNNILSILQQWQIQRMFDRDKPAHAKR